MRILESHFPRRVIIGRGAIGSLPGVCRDRGWRRVFLVTDGGVVTAGLARSAAGPLEEAGLLAQAFDAVPPEPPVGIVDQIAERIRACGADAVLAVGGGSVMDAAKVAALCAGRGGPARGFLGIGKAGGRGLPTLLVPTTAGTGSEATFVAILTDEETGNKVGVVDPCLLADVAVVDPALTDALPRAVTAASGMDALVHAVEAFIARSATPAARGLALEAARHLGRWLEVVCREPVDLAARDGMAIGSHLAGLAFANSSCCAVHALALPLGGRFSIAHGVITGCLAGEIMRYNGPGCADDLAEMGVALGWGALAPDAFGERLDRLAGELGLRAVLRHARVPVGSIPAMAADAVANRRLMDPNPRELALADAVRVYETVLGRDS
jgi:alcohol dehydrogenase class IV